MALEWFGVRGFGAGMVWGSRFWCWNGLGFKVLGWNGLGFKVLGLGFRVWYWGSGFGIGVQVLAPELILISIHSVCFRGFRGSLKKSENNLMKIPFKKNGICNTQLVDFGPISCRSPFGCFLGCEKKGFEALWDYFRAQGLKMLKNGLLEAPWGHFGLKG